jgi:hypothetical protein
MHSDSLDTNTEDIMTTGPAPIDLATARTMMPRTMMQIAPPRGFPASDGRAEAQPDCGGRKTRNTVSGRTRLVRRILFCLLFSGAVVSAQAQTWYESSKYYNPAPYKQKERLRFKVKYGFIRLGTMEIRQKLLDTTAYEVTMILKSASGLPFIDLDSYVKALLVAGSSRSYDYLTIAKGAKKERIAYRYDPLKGLVTLDSETEEAGKVHRTYGRTEPFYDGAGFIMLCRCLSSRTKSVTVASIMDLQFRNTMLRFEPKCEEIEVDAIDHPVRARRIESTAEWTNSSAAGLGGNFTLWVSDDAAAVPLRAEVAIALGSIKIELEAYSRDGWTPAVL